MKKYVIFFMIFMLVFLCPFNSFASTSVGRSGRYFLNGVNDDFDGNGYGWYAGDPDGSVVIITGLGNSQSAYDDNAIPSYTNSIWSDKNVYWFEAEVPGRSGSIHDGFSKTELDVFAQAHYFNVKSVFPNATTFIIGGYSAGGWSIASMIDTVLNNNDIIIGVYGLDCVPKTSASYNAFSHAITTMGIMNIPVFIGSSLANATGNRIEARTAKFAKEHSDVVSFYGSYDCTHGELCKQSSLIRQLTDFVDASMQTVSQTEEDSLSNVDLSNDKVRFCSVSANDVGCGENCIYTFLFDILGDNGGVVDRRSISLFDYQVRALTDCDSINDECLEKCVVYYLDFFASELK